MQMSYSTRVKGCQGRTALTLRLALRGNRKINQNGDASVSMAQFMRRLAHQCVIKEL